MRGNFYAKKLPKYAIFSKIGYFMKNLCPGVEILGKNLGPVVGNLCQNFWPGGTKSPPLPGGG